MVSEDSIALKNLSSTEQLVGLLSNLKINEQEVKHFGGQDVIKTQILIPKQNKGGYEDKEVASLIAQTESLSIGASLSFEDDPLITCLVPQNFQTFVKSLSFHTFLMLYNSDAKYSSQLNGPLQNWQRLANDTKNLITDLKIACYDLDLYDVPDTPEKEMAKIKEASLKAPLYTLFPKDNKKGLRYSFEPNLLFMTRFVCQKCMTP